MPRKYQYKYSGEAFNEGAYIGVGPLPRLVFEETTLQSQDKNPGLKSDRKWSFHVHLRAS